MRTPTDKPKCMGPRYSYSESVISENRSCEAGAKRFALKSNDVGEGVKLATDPGPKCGPAGDDPKVVNVFVNVHIQKSHRPGVTGKER